MESIVQRNRFCHLLLSLSIWSLGTWDPRLPNPRLQMESTVGCGFYGNWCPHSLQSVYWQGLALDSLTIHNGSTLLHVLSYNRCPCMWLSDRLSASCIPENYSCWYELVHYSLCRVHYLGTEWYFIIILEPEYQTLWYKKLFDWLQGWQ